MSAPVQVGPSPSGGGPVPSPDWDDVLADIGDRVRAERQARRWSQSELGQRAGLGVVAVNRLETGKSTLLSNFVMACAALNVDMAHLLSDEWALPAVGPTLAPAQVRALREVAGGDPLRVAGARLGMSPERLASHLSLAYRRLGVSHLPRGERRAAAVRVAMQHDLFNTQNRTS
jgi:transcriptional regulator with XRE-family HTH domain